MDLTQLTQQMLDQADAIRALAEGITDEQARWRPDAKAWSILEVLNHLHYEEREDFKGRLDYIFHRPGEAAPGIDPQDRVKERQYNERDPGESLAAFLRERSASIEWLKSLGEPNWDAALQTPWGDLRAGDVMVAWVAHDLLHARQLVELRYAWVSDRGDPYRPGYAGQW